MTDRTRAAARRWAFRLLLVLSLAGAVVAYAGPLLFELRGERLFVLTSGSMQDLYPVGTAVVARPVTPDQLRVGQVVTFRPPDRDFYVTHEIIAFKRIVDPGRLDGRADDVTRYYVQTKGTNNEDPDPNLTPVTNVRYLVVDGYPGVGRWLVWSRTLQGKVVLFLPPFLLLFAAELWSWRRPRRARRNEPSTRLPGGDDVSAVTA